MIASLAHWDAFLPHSTVSLMSMWATAEDGAGGAARRPTLAPAKPALLTSIEPGFAERLDAL
jgi:hypothetical protein